MEAAGRRFRRLALNNNLLKTRIPLDSTEMEDDMISPLQKQRLGYKPRFPEILKEDLDDIAPVYGEPTTPAADAARIRELFPKTFGLPEVRFAPRKDGGKAAFRKRLNVGVILSGGQAPGGHNVICGLYDALRKADPANTLIGFKGGPSGLTDDKFVVLDDAIIDAHRNTGGFDMIGSGRTKLETEEQFAKVVEVCRKHSIEGLVIIGGDDSNTNAAMLAEHFAASGVPITVVGCPKTIDGDLKNKQIEVSFGFDTATKVYSELIGNIGRDAASARKYWHFIRLMGRSASHIALECALQTHPNICLVGEEIEANGQSLAEIASQMAAVIARRAEDGNNFGVALVPEGIVEFVPEVKVLIGELNNLVAEKAGEFGALVDINAKRAYVQSHLGEASAKVFGILPEGIQGQLLADRDPHGNIQVSRIETEKLLMQMVAKKLAQMKEEGTYKGKFSAQTHFFGYEGRAGFPSNFDADYCYSLGRNAFALLSLGLSGYLSSICRLASPAKEWSAGGIPITMMMNIELRSGKEKPVIRKALVDLEGRPFRLFAENRERWARETDYVYPGAIQYAGDPEVCDRTTMTLALEQGREV